MPPSAFLGKVRKALCLGSEPPHSAAAAGINQAVQNKSLAPYQPEGKPGPPLIPTNNPSPPTLPTLDPNVQSASSPAQLPDDSSPEDKASQLKEQAGAAGARTGLGRTAPLEQATAPKPLGNTIPTAPPCKTMPADPPPAALPSWSELRCSYTSAPSAAAHARMSLARRAVTSKAFGTLGPSHHRQDTSTPAAQPLLLHASRACRSIIQPRDSVRLNARSGPAACPTSPSARPATCPRSLSCSATSSSWKAVAAGCGPDEVQAAWSQPYKSPSPSTRPSSSPRYSQLSLLDLHKALQLGPPSAQHKPRRGLEGLMQVLQMYSSSKPVDGATTNMRVMRRYSSLSPRPGIVHQGAEVQDVSLDSMTKTKT